jgi:hypothetical protein
MRILMLNKKASIPRFTPYAHPGRCFLSFVRRTD